MVSKASNSCRKRIGLRLRKAALATSTAVGVRAVTYRRHLDDVTVVVQVVENAVGASPSRPRRRQWWTQRLTDSVWILEQRPGNEGVGRGGDLLR